jgi:hypothetical protein
MLLIRGSKARVVFFCLLKESPMHAFLIEGKKQAIEAIEISSRADIAKLVGQDTIISDEMDDSNAVYFDEDCFIRGTSGRFQIDKLAPVAGKAVVTGYLAGEQLTNASISLEELTARIKFL